MNFRDRNRRRFRVEGLEVRLALSSVTGIDDHGRHAGKPAEVRGLKHGADDPANHNAADDKGGLRVKLGKGHGADDPANHDANDNHKQKGKAPKVKIVTAADDKGGLRGKHGKDDPAGHR